MQNYRQTDEQKKERGHISSDYEESSLNEGSPDFGADTIDGKNSNCFDEIFNRNNSTFDEKEKREEEHLLSPDEEGKSPIGEGTDSTDDNIIDASTKTSVGKGTDSTDDSIIDASTKNQQQQQHPQPTSERLTAQMSHQSNSSQCHNARTFILLKNVAISSFYSKRSLDTAMFLQNTRIRLWEFGVAT